MPVSKNRRKRAHDPANADIAPPNGRARRLLLIGSAAAALLGGGLYFWAGQDDGAHVSVTVPTLTGIALNGETLFQSKCISCHGQNAAGSNSGPPLVHKIYEPGHHGDSAFYSAVARGVRAHHWQYGNMPPVRGLSTQDIRSIVAFVRALQVENGIR